MPAIGGTVRRGGMPLGGVYVRLIGPSLEFVAEIYTQDDGVFTFHVTDGSWRIEARAAGAEPASETVEVSGEDVTVSIDLER